MSTRMGFLFFFGRINARRLKGVWLGYHAREAAPANGAQVRYPATAEANR